MSQKLVLYVLLAVVGAAVSLPSLWADEPVEFAAGEILLKFKEGISEAEQQNIFNKYSLTKIQFNPTIKTYLTIAKEDDVTMKVSQLNQEPSIKYAQPNYVKKKNTTPNDPYYSSQWHLPHIGMPTAWSEFTGTDLVKVGLIDTGVNKTLTDLAGVLISDGEWDYINGDSNADDTDGHGTLIAGIIAATANNSLGVAGISSRARILPFRQDGFVSDINDAMVRAYNSGCKIINASYGSYIESPAERSQISWLNDRGVLVVCSAGNDGTNNDTRRHYPCGYDLPNIISVANSTSSSVLSSSSNYGATTVDIAAPGTSIFSTLGVGEEFREVIRTYSFNISGESWQAFYFSTGGLSGFFWNFSEGAWITDYFIATLQYAANSSFYVESPLIDCRGYLNINLLSTFSGGLGAGDLLGIYSGTAGWSNKVQAGSLVSGLVNGTYTRNLTPMENSIGRIWYWLTSDWFGNGYLEINNVEVSGIPIYDSSSGTSFAAPVVTGVAAMLMSQNPSLTHLEVKDIILQTARKVSALNGKVLSGGIVDAAAALREAKARIVVNPPVIQNPAPLSVEIGTSFSYNINASNTPHSFGASGLPPGLTINTTTGLISGTPTLPGSFSVTIFASNSAGTGSATITLSVLKNTPTVTSIPVASNIYDGQPLSDSVISGGSFNVEGSFLWANPHIVPTDADSFQEIIFIPSDTSRYNNVTLSIPISVIEAPDHVRSLASCEIKIILPGSLVYDGTHKEISATASPTNVSSKREKKLVHVGNSSTGYGTISGLGPEGFRSVTNLGVNGVFRPHQSSTLISTTGLRFSFPTNLVSANPGGDTVKPPWKKNADSTGGPTGGLTSYFTGLGINWSSNSLFAVPCAGITFDLNEIRPPGQDFTRFTTYFAMHSGNSMGDAAYAILVDGNLFKSGRNFTSSAPYSSLIEAEIPANARFLTLVVGDNGDDMNWDHGVFVNPTLYAATQIPLSILYEGINPTAYGPTTNPPANPGQYRLTMSDSTGRYSGTYTTNISILKLIPTVTNLPMASPITFGQALSNSVLSGGSNVIAGSWAWATGSITPNASLTNRYSVVFTPSNTATHSSVTSSIPLIVSKATPLITWINPSPIIYGTVLSTNTVLNASANTEGTFQYNLTNGSILNAGTYTLTAVFTASNTNNFLSPRTNSVTLTVSKATPGFITPPGASPIVFGQVLSNSILDGGSAGWPMVSTLAGSGFDNEGVGDYLDGPGAVARFYNPQGIAVDSQGNVFVADYMNSRIRVISSNGVVTTLAGGRSGHRDGVGTNALFGGPRYLSIDSSRNLYVTDYDAFRLRKITSNGVVTTMAGAGISGFSNGIGTNALFAGLNGVAVDQSGNVFVVDSLNHRIRKITPPGVVTTLAGSSQGYSDGLGTAAQFDRPIGLALDSTGNLYVSEYVTGRIRKVTAEGLVTTLTLKSGQTNSEGSAIALDRWGNIYTVFNSTQIRKIDTNGNIVTLAGSGWGFSDGIGTNAMFSACHGLALDSNGNIYVADTGNHRIRKISNANIPGRWTWVTPTNRPGAVGVTNFNVIFTPSNTANFNTVTTNVSLVVNQASPAITRLPTASVIGRGQALSNSTLLNGLANVPGSFVWTVPSNIPATGTNRLGITFLPTDSGNYLSISTNIALVVTQAVVNPTFTSATQTIATENSFIAAFKRLGPLSINFAPRPGQTLRVINNTSVNEIVGEFDGLFEGGTVTASFGGNTFYFQISYKGGDGNDITLTRTGAPGQLEGYVVSTLAGSGGFGLTNGVGTNASFGAPTAIAVDSEGFIYVSGGSGSVIRKVSPEGIVTTFSGSGFPGPDDGPRDTARFNLPTGLAVDQNGNVFVADQLNNRIRKVNPDGFVTTIAGSGASGSINGNTTNASFFYPAGITMDNQGNIYISEIGNHSIRAVTTNGVVTTFAGTGMAGFVNGVGTNASFNYPSGIALDKDGSLYIADQINSVIRKVTTSAEVTTVAGTTNGGVVWDSAATNSSLSYPKGVAVDSLGNLFITDGNNSRILKLYTNGNLRTVAGGGYGWGFKDGRGPDAMFYDPSGVAVDKSNNTIYVADRLNNRIRKIVPTNEFRPIFIGYNGSTGPNSAIRMISMVNPNGFSTTVRFIYGTNSNNLNLNANLPISPNNGTNPLSVTSPAFQLQRGIYMYYQFVATNVDGEAITPLKSVTLP